MQRGGRSSGSSNFRPRRVCIALPAASAPTASMQTSAPIQSVVVQLRNLVAEADALFGARHYRHYHWLLALSDHVERIGLEHHESSDNRAAGARVHDDGDCAAASRSCSRTSTSTRGTASTAGRRGWPRPTTRSRCSGELLWVYEGLTRYLGDFCSPRAAACGPPEDCREYAGVDRARNSDATVRAARWRPLADTAVAAQIALRRAARQDAPSRRALDYYDESTLIWLEADTIIRAQTNGGEVARRLLPRLLRRPPTRAADGASRTRSTTSSPRSNEVAPNDWRGFFASASIASTPHAPLGGLEAAGWRLVYNDKPNGTPRSARGRTSGLDVSFSLGMWVKDDGEDRRHRPRLAGLRGGPGAGHEAHSP